VVKLFLLLCFFSSLAFSQTELQDKIESLIGKSNYEKNQNFIDIIFNDESTFYVNDRLDIVSVMQTLKDNGLLKLFFKQPQHLKLTFHTNGSALFFVTIMGDTLRSIGYYRYLTEYSKSDNSSFVWQIGLTSEYLTDTTVLRRELLKRGCDIIDIERESDTSWNYTIDMSSAHLDVKQIYTDEKILLKRALTAQWIDISKINKAKFTSLGSNRWYPYLSFFDDQLHLLKVYKRDKKTWQIRINIPQNATYVKVSDLYNLKNIKDGLEVEALGLK
jgi:hypothetical protein